MKLLNVSFGIYAFLPQGWLFMLTIIVLESIGLSYHLTNKWKNSKVYKTVVFSNFISGLIGIASSMLLNGGWWLVVWFPWVSDNEVRVEDGLKGLVIFYLIAFISTLLIEGLVNYLLLRKDYRPSSILKGTLMVNVISYVIGSLAMYTYSF